ncbi:hypothetical protein LC612_05375 [Nostoc sp. CHAB 5834]|nr:hypothetical protein [Nostoc sp. CHAB 5834]
MVRAKLDPASQSIQTLINAGKLQVRTSSLITLLNSLNQRLGKGESEAIALKRRIVSDR